MASPIKGASGFPSSRPEIIAEVNKTITTSLNDLPKTEIDALKIKVIGLMKRLNEISTTPEEKTETLALADRVRLWSKSSVAPVSSVAASVLKSAIERHAAASSLITDVEAEALLQASSVIQRCLGPSASCMPFIIRQTSLYARGWGGPTGRDEKCLDLLKEALLTYEKSPESAPAKFAEFFFYMTCKIREKEGYVDPAFLLGLQASQLRKLDILFEPLNKTVASRCPGKEASLEAKKKEEVLNVEYLQQRYIKGCQAAYYLGNTSYTISHIYTGIIFRFLYGVCDCVSSATLEWQKRVEKQNRRSILGMLAIHPQYSKVPEAHRVETFLKINSLRSKMIEFEKSLSQKMADCMGFQEASLPFLTAISEKFAAMEDTPEGDALLAKRFSLVVENFHSICIYNRQLIAYLDEICADLEKIVKTRRLNYCLTLIAVDPEIDWSSVGAEGVLPFLESYISANPKPNLEKYPERARDLIREVWTLTVNTQKTIVLLRAFLKILKKLDEEGSRPYMEDFARLAALQKAGLISMGRSGKVVFTLPSRPLFAIEDEFGERWDLPPMPESSAAAGAAARSVGAVSSEPVKEEAAAEVSVPKGEATSREKSDIIAEVYGKLGLELAEASAKGRFTTRPAQEAFQNAIYYAEALREFLAEFKGQIMESRHLANLQQDMGIAAFYAFEQLLTAIILGGTPTASAAKALFDSLGHRLMSRFLKANLSIEKKLQEVVPEIRSLEGMGDAVKDPSQVHFLPPLLKNLTSLLKRGGSTAEVSEHIRTIALGQTALKGFFTLLYTSCLDRKMPLKEVEALFEQIRIESPPSAAGGSAGASAAAGDSSVRDEKVRALADKINTALDHSNTYELTEQRRFLLNHNLERLDYLIDRLRDPASLPHFSFYASQARYILTILMEEFLCAACESQTGAVDQAEAKHNLSKLAEQIKILASLSKEEKQFLAESAGKRNELRYDNKFVRHAAGVSSGAGAAAIAASRSESDEEGFTRVLASSHAKMLGILEVEINMALALCDKIATRSFAK